MRQAPPCPPLAEPEWLLPLLGTPGLVVLDASIDRQVTAAGSRYGSGRAGFEAGHIPGALFADLFGAFSDPDGRFPFTRPTAAALAAEAARLGLSPEDTIVVCDSLNGVWAARVRWVLKAFGARSVFVLNGGLAGWRAAGGAIATGPDSPPGGGTFRPRPVPGLFADTGDVLAILAGRQPGALFCALRRAEFEAGHIPSSQPLPYADLLDAAGRLDPGRLSALLPAVPEGPLVLYCGGGVNAAGLALALEARGRTDIAVYDGSLNEWKATPGLPLATGPGV
ncbi:rhodanese-like domain-containing protein [Pseudoxanthobacter sp.]|uniref:sulfurtransferase n=1 Tax=Pseudoxanthobacter sp. TaxID=1925742 RepID=UPI002FE39ACE